jgi:IclR family transcriptional regulator, acetate operon repressor
MKSVSIMSKIVDRTLDLLELFGQERRPLSLSDLARLLRIPISSCHDVVQAMQTRGYIYEIAPRGGYYPTLRLHALGKEIGDNDPVLMRTELLLRSLRDSLDESVLLSKVAGLNARYLLVFEPTHPLRILVKVGDSIRSIYGTSAGKALLGSLDDRALAAYLKSVKLVPLTKNTFKSAAALRKDIDLGRKRGWYLNREESLNGVTTMSASFRWNASVYVVTIAGPSSRLVPKLAAAASLLTDICNRLEIQSDNRAGSRGSSRHVRTAG